MAQNGLLYDLHDKPKFGQLLIFALQQVLAVIAATIAVPTISDFRCRFPPLCWAPASVRSSIC